MTSPSSRLAAEGALTDMDTPKMLVHLSDCHLLADPLGTQRDTHVLQNLHAVMSQIQDDGIVPDLIVATGDIAHDGSPQAYTHFQQACMRLDTNVRALAGNRDDGSVMREVLQSWCDPVTDLGANWRIVTLDSTVAGERHGHLNGTQFAMLDEAVASAGDRHILVAMHHNPVIDQSAAADPAMLDNARILLTHLTAWQQARVLLWGHIHRAHDCRVDNMRLLSAPATSFQFCVRDGQYCLEDKPPGYRWIKLYDDGSIATGVKRIKNGTPDAGVP